ncbi:hypothetical protein QFC21_000491 [Naganishia friedmannii]|uniref:Uncharacterized protein n=1 Tax=Naganishia friedmannii TaxID=89922 RepID=A0ACC2WBM8_9TREE|nr:hypothetical protein QFC21_000491 [Naganishia friedmannii]
MGETAADQLRHLRISLISGEIVGSTVSNPVDTTTVPIAVFQHLPLAHLRSDNGNVTFEDGKHLHAIDNGAQRGHRFRIKSFPKSRKEVTQYTYLGPGLVSGWLTLTPVDCEFQPQSQPESATIKTKCPSALGILLQSGTQLKNVFGRSFRGAATVYLLHVPVGGPVRAWKIKVSVIEGQLSIKQMKPGTTDQAVANEKAGAYDDVQIVKKAGSPEPADECPVFCLACVRGGAIDSFNISVENENFNILHSRSLPFSRDGLKRISIDAFGKVATVNTGVLRVWDAESACFGSGLEYVSDIEHTVQACAFSPDQTHTLAFAYGNTVTVLCLMSHGMQTRWVPVFSVVLPIFSVADITNLAWIPGDCLFVTNDVQASILSDVLDRGGYSSSIVNVIASKRAPLPDAHPENLLQCVIWDKFSLVKLQLKQISLALKAEVAACHLDLSSIDVELYVDRADYPIQEADPPGDRYQNHLKSNNRPWQALLSSLTAKQAVLRALSHVGLYKLSLEDVDTLASLSRTMGYADEQAQALDANGRRFLLAFSRVAGKKGDLSHAEATWALHSESKTVNLQTVISQCHNELILWSDVKRYKLSYWLEDLQITELAEVLARNHFITEGRNPIPTSIYYFALRKPKTVWGLWRQVSHPERAAMIKFLQNNFEDPRWQSAAVKNAYALLGKQRFQYAAAFFLLGDRPKDAIHVCIKQLQDYDLAIFIARTRHDRATLLPWLIETYLRPKGEATCDKWLLHWCHWVQGQKENAIRVLYAPRAEQPATDSIPAADEYHRDDATTMAVLLSDFKTRAETTKLCANVVPIELETEIVRYSASRLRAIGCEALALSVIRDWHFTPPVRTTAKPPAEELRVDTQEHTGSNVSPLEARFISKERSAVASVIATGPVQDSNETQGGMDFDMGAFF